MKTLRDYQVEAVAAARRDFESRKSALIVLPTGTGKTVVMAKMASEWRQGNVLLLAHRIELLEQAQRKLAGELGFDPVIEQARRGMDPNCLWQGGMTVVASVQTLCNRRRLEKFARHPFGLVMVDEAHHATAASYRRIVDYFTSLNPECRVLGVTATPRRADKTALGLVFEAASYTLGIQEAILSGWLVPIVQEYVAVKDVDFSGVRVTRDEFGESDFNAQDLESVLTEEKPLQEMAVPILEKSGTRQALVFTAGVRHAHLLAAVLNRSRPESAEAVDGETAAEKRKAAVDRFAQGRLQFLVNYGVFTEGFDVPPVAVVAMGRPTKSVGLYTQMLGRGMRPLDGVADGWDCAEDRRMAILTSDKPSVLVLDFVGNSEHKLVSSVDVLGGNYDLVEIREAKDRIASGTPADVLEELKKAKAEVLLEREQAKRREIKAKVAYSTVNVDPFGDGPSPTVHEGIARGGATDSQIQLLVNLGIDRDAAMRFGKRQASAVIEKQKAARCTNGQREQLIKYGEDPNVPFDKAHEVLNEIAANGWRRRNRDGRRRNRDGAT